MTTRPKYPYPIPELIAHLEQVQACTQESEQIYHNLARLLKICHATMEHARELWEEQRFLDGEALVSTCQTLNYALKRLVPLALDCTVGGWNELLIYVEHPERYPWYDPQRDWPSAPTALSEAEEELIVCEVGG
jgi:hypothetical protein